MIFKLYLNGESFHETEIEKIFCAGLCTFKKIPKKTFVKSMAARRNSLRMPTKLMPENIDHHIHVEETVLNFKCLKRITLKSF